MKKEYDFSNSIKNPYTQKEKKQISINIETDSIAYFKALTKNQYIKISSLLNVSKHLHPNKQKL